MAQPSQSIHVSFLALPAQLEQLDTIAKLKHRDRSQIIGEAVEQYLEMQHHNVAKIEAGIAAADRGDFATQKEIEAEFARWRS